MALGAFKEYLHKTVHVIQRYGLAMLWSFLFAGLRSALTPLLPPPSPLIVLLAAPLLAAWHGGLGPGLAATVMSLLIAAFVFPSPGSLDNPGLLSSWLEVLIYLIYGSTLAWLMHKRVHALELAERQSRHLAEAQQALAEREQRAQDTLEASPSGMIVVNRKGVIELVNSQAERMFGGSREALIGQSVDQLVPEASRGDHVRNRERFHANPSSRAMGGGRDLWARRGNGTVFPVEIGLNPLKGASTGLVLASIIDISARKQAEHELAMREERMRETLEASPAGMMVVNRQGVIELVNSQAERLFNLRRDQLIGQSIDALVPDAVRAGHAANRERFHANPSARAMGAGRDLWAKRGDGTVFPVEIGLNPLKGASTGLVLASVIDISARKRVEEALRDSDQRARESSKLLEADHAILDALLRAVPAGIILVDAKGRLIHSNPANDQIWGPAPATRQVEDYAHWKGWWANGSDRQGQPLAPEDWALAQALRGQSVHDDLVEIEPFDRPGQRTTLVITASPIRDVQGCITGAVVAQMDVTELTQAQAAESKSAEMFKALADNIAQLAWMTDERGVMVWFNRRWFDYTGSNAEDMRGWGWQAAHHPDHMARVVCKFRSHIKSGEPWEDTFPLRQHDGQYRWFLSRAFPIHDQHSRISSWFGTNTDITAQREAEEALREADSRKDEFIAVLAHELRNPLAPVQSAVEILKRIASDDKRLERTCEVIGRQVTHMARLIDDLLDVSRISRGKLALQTEVCDLAAIMRHTAEDYRTSLEGAGLALEIQTAQEPIWVHGDPVRLAQMLGNLLTNAQRFNNPGCHISMSLRVDDSEGLAWMEVADDGIGIDPELMSRLFDPFEQAVQDLARARGGLGLGLALTKGLAELHGGRIHAHSVGLGHGAVFKLCIPLHPAPIDPRPAKANHQHSDKDLRILIIEDNHDAALTLAELLQLNGHDVETSFDGTSGLAKVHEFFPHIVISDLGLPGELDGYELAKLLRSHPDLGTLRLIALSGYADLEARKRSAEAGYDIHLAKPADINMLERVISDLR